MDRDDYEDLVDARDHAVAMREVAGEAPVLTGAELDAYLSAATCGADAADGPHAAKLITWSG